jgi:hypothetical protein
MLLVFRSSYWENSQSSAAISDGAGIEAADKRRLGGMMRAKDNTVHFAH